MRDGDRCRERDVLDRGRAEQPPFLVEGNEAGVELEDGLDIGPLAHHSGVGQAARQVLGTS